MHIVELLRNQHREILDQLEHAASETDRKQRKAMLSDAASKLRAHMMCEEKLLYPTCAKTFDDDTLVLGAVEEHALARQALATLEATSVGDKRFAARAKVLSDLLRHHVDEEEGQLLPELEAHLPAEEMDRMGVRFEKRYEAAREVPAAPRRRAPAVAARRPTRAAAATRAKPPATRGARGARATRGARRGAAARG